MNKDAIYKFFEDHRIKLLDTNKRTPHDAATVQYFCDPTDYNKFYQDFVAFQTEPVYTIEIAESELKRIAEFENQVFNNMKTRGHYNIFEILMEQKEREKYLREKYPAVKKVYEQYSMMLKLAESGEI